MRVRFLGMRTGVSSFLPRNLVSYPAQTAMRPILVSVGLVTVGFKHQERSGDFAKINSGTSCHPSTATEIPGPAVVDDIVSACSCLGMAISRFHSPQRNLF